MEPTKDIEESPNVISLMRKTVKVTVRLGIIMVLSGIAFTAYSLFTGKGFELMSIYSLLIVTGSGVITGAIAGKAWQAQAENRNPS